MNIGIAGLGLMGGSMLKAIKKSTSHRCFGYNRTHAVLKKAEKYLDGVLCQKTLKDMDLVIVCLNPQLTVDYILNNLDGFKKDAIIIDVCGVKRFVVEKLDERLYEKSLKFVPCHPMAGKEVGGYKNSSSALFKGASFIITPTQFTDIKAVELMEELARTIGFSKVVKASPEEHDSIIAYTSQLAHVVSNAYAKSPNISKHQGFSAGSFQDLTRVARLDSRMWAELLKLNKDNILAELELIIHHLEKYKKAMIENDFERLQALLEKGNIMKINSLNNSF
ncbi:MAG: prephenate dehydrogenase [Bacillota bacterium]|jgi:prephenate dehydrogenase|nr:prephenate dehydrogenase [Bacillota bacterium]HHU42985.1 prephenate dehydrogenase [Clostridiales bacterium]